MWPFKGNFQQEVTRKCSMPKNTAPTLVKKNKKLVNAGDGGHNVKSKKLCTKYYEALEKAVYK